MKKCEVCVTHLSLTAYKADVFMSAEVEPLEIQTAGRSESGPKQSVRV